MIGFEKIIESMDFSQINQNYNDHLQLLNETNKNLPSLKIEFEKYNRTVQFLEDAYQQQLKEGRIMYSYSRINEGKEEKEDTHNNFTYIGV